jgi:hypothetical protein
MRWRRCEPLQSVGALILIDVDARARLEDTLLLKSRLFRALPIAWGEGWVVLFSAPVGDLDEPVLPQLPGAIALHEATEGWWLPVGVELEAPVHVHAALWASLTGRCDVTPPAVVLPRFALDGPSTHEADVFLVRDLQPIEATPLDTRRL